MDWLRAFNAGGNSLPHIVNPGPAGSLEILFSFDFENAYFVVINKYFDGSTDSNPMGDVTYETYRQNLVTGAYEVIETGIL